MENKIDTKSTKKRGYFLTVIYVYGFLQAILLFFSGIIYPLMTIGTSSTEGKLTLLVSALEFIPLVIALYGIWKWKKSGFYLLITYFLISLIATFIFDILLKIYAGYAQYVISLDILNALLWFWALFRKRSYFS